MLSLTCSCCQTASSPSFWGERRGSPHLPRSPPSASSSHRQRRAAAASLPPVRGRGGNNSPPLYEETRSVMDTDVDKMKFTHPSPRERCSSKNQVSHVCFISNHQLRASTRLGVLAYLPTAAVGCGWVCNRGCNELESCSQVISSFKVR